MDTDRERRYFMSVLRGAAKPNLRFDKRQEDWTLMEHTPRRIVCASNLELVSFAPKQALPIQGYETPNRMPGRVRCELYNTYGQEDAEWLLENQADIPPKLRQYSLVFIGTIWQSLDGSERFPYLCWDGGRWNLGWRWI